MEITYYISLSLFFFVIAAGMIIINKATKSKMKFKEVFTVILCIAISIGIGYLGFNSFMDSKIETLENLYTGYTYFLEGSVEKADQYFSKELVSDNDNAHALYGKGVIRFMNGDYKGAKKILKKASSKTKEEGLNNIIKSKLKSIEDIEENGLNEEDREEIIEDFIDSVEDVARTLGNSNRKVAETIEDCVEIEEKLNKGGDIEEIKEDIEDLLDEDKDNADIKKLLVNAYLQEGEYEEAFTVIKEVVEQEDDLNNLVFLADVMAECYNNDINLLSSNDSEIKEIEEEIDEIIDELEEETEDLEKGSYSSEEKREKIEENIIELKIEKQQLEKDRNGVIIERVIGLLEAKLDISDINNIVKDLQIAKLYHILGDNEKSKEYIDEITKALSILKNTDSYFAESLQEFNEHVNKSREEKNEEEIKKAVEKVINTVNSEVSQAIKNNEKNQGWEDFLVAYAKYANVPLIITRVEADNYPEITAYANIGGDMEQWFHDNATFDESYFQIDDTETDIKDFTVEKIEGSRTNICLVIDKSGSMMGSALEGAKTASIEFIRKIADEDRITLLAFSNELEILSELSKDKIELERKVYTIEEGGGTSLYDAGIEAVNKIKNEKGRRVVLLLTDGLDEHSRYPLDDLIEAAVTSDVVIYTIGLGEIEGAVLSEIASRTQGQFYNAPNSTELSMVYKEIQDKIKNTYKFTYSVDEEDSSTHRYTKVILSGDKGFDIMDYVVDGANSDVLSSQFENNSLDNILDEEVDKYEFISVDEMDSKLVFQHLSTNNIIKTSKSKDPIITITGNGFNKSNISIKIGNYRIDKNNVQIMNNKELQVTLTEDIPIGTYSIHGENELGEKTSLYNTLTFSEPGNTHEIQLGDMAIKANTMVETAKGYRVSGNIVINDYIYIDQPIELDTGGKHSSDHNYISGTINGNGKIYVKFNKNSDNFIVKNFNVHEQILDKNKFEIVARNSGTILNNLNILDERFMAPILQIQPKQMKILEDEIEITTSKFHMAGLDKESKNAIRNLNKFTKKVPLWVTNSEVKIAVTPEGYSIKSGEIEVQSTVTVVPQIISLEKFKLWANMDEGILGAQGSLKAGRIFGPKLADELELKFKLEALELKLDTIELVLNYTVPIKAPFLYLEGLGGGVSELAKADNILDARIMILAETSSFKIPKKIPWIGDKAVFEFDRLELNTRFSSQQYGFKGSAKFLTSPIGELSVQFGKTKKRPSDVEGFLLEGNTNINLGNKLWQLDLNTDLYVTLNKDGFYSKAHGDMYSKGLFSEFEGGCDSEITISTEFTQFKLSLNNGKDDIELLLRLEDSEDEPFWNLSKRVSVDISF